MRATMLHAFRRPVLLGLLVASLFCSPGCPNAPSSTDNRAPGGSGDAFYVYKDADSPANHYAPSGWMGDIEQISVDPASTVEVPDGETCMMWTYSAPGGSKGWVGVVWQDPKHNWDGEIPNAGYDLDEARFLSFRVRGARGGESVTFGFGGLDGPYPDSVEEKTKKVLLGTEWSEVSIAIERLDLSALHNGFMWTIDSADMSSEQMTFYLDNVRYEFETSEEGIKRQLSGLGFSPFTMGGNPNDGDLATIEQVASHLQIAAPYTEWIRTYGMSGGLSAAGQIAQELDVKAALGAWIDSNDASNNTELDALIAAAKAGNVDIAVVGNEVLHRHDLPLADLVALIYEFRNAVPEVPVTTAEVYSQWITNPELVDACDLLFVHCYPFWEGVGIDAASGALHAQYGLVETVANGKSVVVAETGWPSSGGPIGAAVPSEDNAARYFLEASSWADSMNVQMFYFSAFDEPFKTDEPQGVGPHWGLFDGQLSLKPDRNLVFAGHTSMDEWILGLPCGGGEPAIEFTSVPPFSSYEDLFGKVCNVWPKHHGVAVYIYVGGWWTKPYYDNPVTVIQADGTFTTDVTTGGIDHLATAIAGFVIPSDYDPPIASGGGLPEAVKEAAVASVIVYK